MSNLQEKINNIKESCKPFRSIIWFLVLFISIDFTWKLFVDEGNNIGGPFILGKDFSQFVMPVNLWTAKVTHWLLKSILGHDNIVLNNDLIYFVDNFWIRFKVVWECTGIKQMVVFAILIGLYFGPIKKKLWFIPLSVFILFILNIIRIASIILITKDGFPEWFISFNEWNNNREWENTSASFQLFYNDWFDLFHRDVFSWLYSNGAIFLLWLWWEEKFNLPYMKLKKEEEEEK